MTVHRALTRLLAAVVIALSLALSASTANAGCDRCGSSATPSNVTWENTPTNITWE